MILLFDVVVSLFVAGFWSLLLVLLGVPTQIAAAAGLGLFLLTLLFTQEASIVSEEKEKMMYVHIRTEPNLWTVGFYAPDGKWHPDSDYSTAEAATERLHYLNGGGGVNKQLLAALEALMSHPSDWSCDATWTDDGYLLTPLEIAQNNARAAIAAATENQANDTP